MDLFIDDKVTDPDFTEGRSLDEALRYVQTDICSGHRFVVRVTCDGQEILAEDMEETLRKPADSFGRLELFTNTKGGLVTEAMKEAQASLEQTDRACREAGELLSQGRTVEGIEALGECLAVWQQIHDAVAKSIQLLALKTDSITIQEEPLEVVLSKPRDILTQVKEALESRDMILLADLLIYDLSDVTAQWLAIVNKLRDEAIVEP